MKQSSATPPRPLDQALDALADGLIVLNPDHSIAFANRQAAALCGFSAAEMTGIEFAKFNDLSALNWTLLGEMLEAGRTGNLILRGEATGAVFVTLRRISTTGASEGHVITLRDLAVFDHARRQATGARSARHSPARPNAGCDPISPGRGRSRPGSTG